MAWANIEERRARVRDLLDAGVPIIGEVRKQLAEQFNCSRGAIAADVTRLTTDAGGDTIHCTVAMRRRIYARDGRVCQYCGSEDASNYIIEHVIPAAQGGHAKPYNLVVACASCNSVKLSRVWLPWNLDAITAEHPEWRDRVLAQAHLDKKRS